MAVIVAGDEFPADDVSRPLEKASLSFAETTGILMKDVGNMASVITLLMA